MYETSCFLNSFYHLIRDRSNIKEEIFLFRGKVGYINLKSYNFLEGSYSISRIHSHPHSPGPRVRRKG